MSTHPYSEHYENHGYVRLPTIIDEPTLSRLQPVLERFHERWLGRNREHYENGVINSAYLTRKGDMPDEDRRQLFNFIGSDVMRDIVTAVLPKPAMFVGTQLFFDPQDPTQHNYWHRDIQYRKTPIEEQQRFIKTANLLHVRVAFKDERGVELVPGTHRRWDSSLEYDVRMAANGRQVHDDLQDGVEVSLTRGDAVLFSACMIHRGLYGGDRFALDLLYADADENSTAFTPEDCLPDSTDLSGVAWPAPFNVTRALLENRSTTEQE